MYANLELYIDGQWLNGDGRRGEDVLNPATEKPLAHLPHASTADLDRALEAAKKGFAVWRAASAYDRAKILRKAADLMRERRTGAEKQPCHEAERGREMRPHVYPLGSRDARRAGPARTGPQSTMNRAVCA